MAARQLTREERVAQIRRLAATSLTHRQIAELIGITRTNLRNLLYDPDGSKARARKACRVEKVRLAERLKSEGRIPHGASGYRNWGCRCDVCRAEVGRVDRLNRARLVAEARPEDHGTHRLYAYGCRCDRCRAAGNYPSQSRPRRRQRPSPVRPGRVLQ